MARYKGKDGAVTVEAADVGEVESFDITLSVNELDANVMGNNGWADVEDGLKSASGSIAVIHDQADAGQSELLAVGATVDINLFPAGNTTGLTEISGSFLITEVAITSSATELVKATYNIRNKGVITVGTAA